MKLSEVIDDGYPWKVRRRLFAHPARDGWYDVGLSTPSCILDAIGRNATATVLRQPPGGAVHWGPNETRPQSRLSSVRDLLQHGLRPQPDGSQDYLQEDINAHPGLRNLYRLPPAVRTLPILREKLWIGGPGLRTPLHYDAVETLHWCLRGEKYFKLWAPGHRGMYSAGGKTPFISRVDPEAVDESAFPRFPEAPDIEIHLREGDVLYLPAYWWHHVTSLGDFNVSLNMVWHPGLARRLQHPVQWLSNRAHVARQVARSRALKE